MTELKLLKISDEEYHSLGNRNLKSPKELVSSASFFKDVHDRGLYEALLSEISFNDKTKKNMKTGTMLHEFIFEKDVFDEKYLFDGFDELNIKERVLPEVKEFLLKIREQVIKKYPYLLTDVGNEVTIYGTLFDLKVKSKIDKLVITKNKITIYDLKSTEMPLQYINKPLLYKTINNFHYDLQMEFYKLMVQEWYSQNKDDMIPIDCILVFASKSDFEVRQIKLSEETLLKGKSKIEPIMEEVLEFVNNGTVKKYIEI
jgi:hypothetical protein